MAGCCWYRIIGSTGPWDEELLCVKPHSRGWTQAWRSRTLVGKIQLTELLYQYVQQISRQELLKPLRGHGVAQVLFQVLKVYLSLNIILVNTFDWYKGRYVPMLGFLLRTMFISPYLTWVVISYLRKKSDSLLRITKSNNYKITHTFIIFSLLIIILLWPFIIEWLIFHSFHLFYIKYWWWIEFQDQSFPPSSLEPLSPKSPKPKPKLLHEDNISSSARSD